MTNLERQIVLIIILLQFSACKNQQNQTVAKQREVKSSANIFGLYSYFVTGYNSHCESVKHSLQLNADSTFIFKIYCYADSMSPFQATVKTGKLTKEKDSLFNFISDDKTFFKAEFINDSTIQLVPKKDEEQFNYPFHKDTTTNERFWQIHEK
ncbi:MAG TPA: hypothetical protein PLP23_10090 [Panacibacter sp.]|nr:hypothetical protein [Panacibacter sp.]